MPKFVPRQRKHRVLARQAKISSHSAEPNTNTNIEVLPSISASEKEARRKQLRDELRAQQPQVSSKKQKRLDKYIENKLRKDEKHDYLKRLEIEKERFDVGTQPGFASAKHLNSKKRRFEEFVNERSSVVNDRTVLQHAVQSGKQRDSRAQVNGRKHSYGEEEEDDVVDDASEDSFELEHHEAFDENTAPDADAMWMATKAPIPQGTGLAQPLQSDDNGLPIIPSRSSKKGRAKGEEQTVEDNGNEPSSDDEDVPWEGFASDSEDPIVDVPDDISNTTAEDSQDDFYEYSDQETASSGTDTGSDSESDISGPEAQESAKIGTRVSAFKTWASQQLNQAIGHTPSYDANGEGELLPAPRGTSVQNNTSKELPKLVNGLPAVKGEVSNRPVHSVYVERPEAIRLSRNQLPIIQREQEIMEAIHAHPVVVVKGDTGSGKTTQLPQFLYEAGYGDANGPTPGLIGITQPRRVAAVSMANRVREELGSHGTKVAYQIRFDSTVSNETAVKFMTDGILLRELSQDLLLKKYSAIIIDEAHERSINTDILIGMLSKIVPARMQKSKFNPEPTPLKLIIMSATLNIGDFLHDKLFSPANRPPVVEAEGRQHRVTTHFALRSRADYVEEVIEKVKKAHRKLPHGGILVFLTGQSEIRQAQSRLRSELARSSGRLQPASELPRMHAAASEAPLEMDDLDFGIEGGVRPGEDDEIDILTHSDQENEEREFDISDEEPNDDDRQNSDIPSRSTKRDPYETIHVLPLYSQLPTKEQMRVFDTPPDRARLIVLATNVAETSLTIPGIRFVFDCGRSKERKYDLETGVQSFEIDYISKASAQQRAGRAGRTGPGHCWRLYSSAVYEQFFPEHAEPEILRAPAENIVLQVKAFKYPRPVVDFPFPSAPSLSTLDKAEKLLKNLGALNTAGSVTETGKELSIYPLSPRLGKIIASATKVTGLIAQSIALVAGLTVSEIYINVAAAAESADGDGDDDIDEQDRQKQEYGRAQATLSRHDKSSDALKLLTAISMYMGASDKEGFCKQYFLRPKAMSEITQLASQLKTIVQANNPGMQVGAVKDVKKFSIAQTKQFSNIAAAGYIDQVAVRWDCAPNPPILVNKPRRSIDVPYLPLIPLTSRASGDINDKAVFIHPSSVLSRYSVKDLPQYIVYTHLQQAQSRIIGAEQVPKTRMFPLTSIDGATLSQLASNTAMIEYGKPLPKTKIEDLKGLPKRRLCWVSTELRGGAGFGWSLPPTKVKQVMDVKSSSGWRVEEVLV